MAVDMTMWWLSSSGSFLSSACSSRNTSHARSGSCTESTAINTAFQMCVLRTRTCPPLSRFRTLRRRSTASSTAASLAHRTCPEAR
eukprot:scaffold1852_cov244-Pinguiococcus_pyrenoidosus.AAC.4